MRLEINIPDSTRPAVKARLTSLAQELNENPELVEEIYLNGDAEDAAIQKVFTPELLAEIDTAAAEARAGQTYTRKQVDEFLAENKAAWLANHPS